VNVYKRAIGGTNSVVSDEEIAKSSGLGYNPATIARPIKPADGEKVRSKQAKSEMALGDTREKLQSRL
jgi:sterol carrier protein 2